MGRRPLAYATATALRQAESLLPGRVLENAIEAEIAAGNCTSGTTGGIIFDSSKKWVAVARFIPARIQAGRRAWLVHEVRRY